MVVSGLLGSVGRRKARGRNAVGRVNYRGFVVSTQIQPRWVLPGGGGSGRVGRGRGGLAAQRALLRDNGGLFTARTRSACLLSSRSCRATHPSESFLLDVFFRLGEGILHSMPKAVQFVQGTPRLAASQRTCSALVSFHCAVSRSGTGGYEPFEHGRSVVRAKLSAKRTTSVPRQTRCGRCANGGPAIGETYLTGPGSALPILHHAVRNSSHAVARASNSPAEAWVRRGLLCGRLGGCGLGAVGRGGRGHGHEAALLGHGVAARETALGTVWW